METSFDFLVPDLFFWNIYAELWKNSLYQSSFKAPLFLQFLNSQVKDSLAVFRAFRDKELIGVAFFVKRKNVFHFLSDMKADHNYFIFRKDITKEETEKYFKNFINEIENRKLTFRLNRQPSWASYMDVLRESLSESTLFWKVVDENPCLVLEAESPEALFKATNKQKLRQKLNQLKEKEEVTFEAFQGEEYLDEWLNDFFEVHVKKWAETSTPSSFNNPDERFFYKSCIIAWIKEGILVRFAIRSGNKRIAFVTALLENGYLVHHTTTYDKDYEKQSPGLIIINLISRWMADRKMTKMEFGDGGEAYKYQFTKQESHLLTIFLTSKWNLPFILKTKLIGAVRENTRLRNFYRERIRPLALGSAVLKKNIT